MSEFASAVTESTAPPPRAGRRLHRAWVVAGVTFVTMLAAAGFRAVPGVMIDPLHDEFGWSHGTVGAAIAVNMTLYGLTAPFGAALMMRFGMRPVACGALVLVAIGSGAAITMSATWQLFLLWGLFVGLGTGSLSMSLVAMVSTRWFVARRGLVSGVLTAAGATGQLVFLPVVAALTDAHGWRPASVTVALAALAVVPLVVLLLRDHPADLGVRAYGATDAEPGPPPPARTGNGAVLALTALRDAARRPVFWLLAGSFAICGATTNGLIGTHFIPAAHDHGMPTTTAASLLALIGVFDVAGTIASGWLTDRVDPRLLLVGYYVGRGVALLLLPSLLSPHTEPSTWVFILFYGLDWVATVPPTVALTRDIFGERAPIVFGWIFASHQLGAALAAGGAGLIRDLRGSYALAFYVGAALCLAGALLCLSIRKDEARETP
ncbi:MFS transporter [Jatrophihabitans fulvus]